MCSARGKVKKDVDIYVGDYVEFCDGVIESVAPRKNQLVRPYVANIDVLFITVAVRPKPDWVLVEKLLLNCHAQKITPIIVLNKCDLITEEERLAMLKPYQGEINLFCVSAKTGEGVEELKDYIKGKTVCFSGQSAVGKSSLINSLGGMRLETGELSRKIQRGKNTTRHVEIYDLADGRAVDTCGFSVMETIDVKPWELTYYYDEFVKVQNQCKFDNCTHTTEPSCEVKRLVQEGVINENRYNRYVSLYKELCERRKNEYA